jgi:hypothetical protein
MRYGLLDHDFLRAAVKGIANSMMPPNVFVLRGFVRVRRDLF